MIIYRCSECGGTFESEWDDAEALAEAQTMFKDYPVKDLVVVCDVCWRKMGFNEGSV